MYRTVQFCAAALFSVSTACSQAEQKQLVMDDLFQDDRQRWQQIDHHMSPDRYTSAAHDNQRLLRKSAQRFLDNGLTSLGVPKQGIALTGAVVGLAISGGKLNLNESKTMLLELDEMTSEDRALSFKLKLNW
jgi:hypothetical protein